MEAHLTPRRLLAIVAIVAATALASACGAGGGNAQAAKDPQAPVKYTSSQLSFTHPAAWTAYPFRWPGELHFKPIVYLSTQPVHDPCTTNGNETSCGFPVRHLARGGVLIVWQVNGIPVSGIRAAPGTPTQVGGTYAKRVTTDPGSCRAIGADRTIEVVIGSPTEFGVPTDFVACLRGPGLAQEERAVDALLASTRLPSPSV